MTHPSRAVEKSLEPRATCYRCFKPAVLCLCFAIPRVDNETHIYLLQHPRERFHPLGTARIALQGLSRVSRVGGERAGQRYVVPRPALRPHTGLLYPGPGARELASLSPEERPEALVVLDGTWSQAKSLYEANPWLAELSPYRLSPEVPSRYRIRRQPERHCLSTIESIVAALAWLEPATAGLEGLVGALDEMIDRQVTQRPEQSAVPRFKRPRRRGPRHVPSLLVEQPERIVAVYGEAAQREGPRTGQVPMLLQWTAVRPFAQDPTREAFEYLLAPPTAPRPGYLSCLGFDAGPWPADGGLAAFRDAWDAWSRSDDVLAPWNDTALSLLFGTFEPDGPGCERAVRAARPRTAPRRGCDRPRSIRLKESYCNVRGGRCGSLLDVVDREALALVSLPVRGRAGRRLSATAAIARWLHARGQP